MNGYKLYQKQPNTIHKKGRLFIKTFHFDTKNEFKERKVRVYLPSNYDDHNPNKRFKTIYMLDGKNLFDDYTSFVGEWGIDEAIESFIKKGDEGYIVIGIDAPGTDIGRSLEMSPDNLIPLRKYHLPKGGYASLLAKFIFEVVKPDIDRTFFTKPEREYTGVGGSSMGGIMAFYLGMEYSDKIKYCLNFSPAFFLYDWESFREYLDQKISTDLPRQFFYIGGKDFESVFVETTLRTYNYFKKHGWDSNDLKLLYDSEQLHNEGAWRHYFPIALKKIDN